VLSHTNHFEFHPLSATSPTTDSPTESPSWAPATFSITAVAIENDACKDAATNTTTFTVNFWEGVGPGYDPAIPPLPPIVDVGPNIGLEDNNLVLDIDAKKNESDTTEPTISVVFSNIPSGFSIDGDFYFNYETGKEVALASSVKDGRVSLIPPLDFGGFTSLTIEAIAVNSYFLTASTDEMTISPFFDYVADGPSISIAGISGGGTENEDVQLPISLSVRDVDGSEAIGDYVYVTTCNRAVLKPEGYATVSSSDDDATIGGISVTNFYRIPIAEAGSLSMTPDDYWHGPCGVAVVGYSYETEDDQDGDYLKAVSQTFTAKIVSVPTPPSVTAPESISGDEDIYIAIEGLSAALVDTIDENGYESLSVVMINVPEGSLFNFGSNSGEGKWSLKVKDLPNLEIKPPPQYAGAFTMTFQGISYDHATSTDATTSSAIAVTVNPVADSFDLVARNLEAVAGETMKLDLNLLLYDAVGFSEGEVPPEVVTMNFFDVPMTVILTAPAGGQISLMNNVTGEWQFVGSEEEANGVTAVIGQQTLIGDYNISLSVFTTDQSSVLAPPVFDSFMIYVVGTTSEGATSRQLSSTTDYSRRRRLNSTDALDLLVGPVCGSEPTLGWESLEGASRFDANTISIDSQDQTSVTYTLPDVLLDAGKVNWAAIVLPEEARGQTVCRVPTVDRITTFKGNCFDYQSSFFLLLNVQAEGQLANYDNHPVPTFCDVPAVEGGRTIMLEVSVPCARCNDSPAVGERRLAVGDPGQALLPEGSNNSLDTHWLARTLSSKNLSKSRRLQETLEAASTIEMQLTIVGTQTTTSSGASFISYVGLMVFTTSCLLLSFL
jgi:hypothetical protein